MGSKKLPKSVAVLALLFPFITAADEGEGCGSNNGGAQITPDVTGEWSLAWQDDLHVEINIGGAVYEETLGAQGGVININHEGNPISFDLDCARAEVVCPSEVWPSSVSLDQRDEGAPRNVYVTIPVSECMGTLTDAPASECSDDAETCQVCEGEVVQSTAETFGRIAFTDDRLDVLLGGGITSNGVNCALLGLSIATATLATEGTAQDGDWTAVSLDDGSVITGYAGGCLWAGDVNDDGTIEALAIGATVRLSTSFTGARQ